MTGLRFQVSDLVDRPGEKRVDGGEIDVDLTVGESRVNGPASVTVTLQGIDDGVLAEFTAVFNAHLVCTRCLAEWDETIEVSAVQVFAEEPDEDGYALAPGATIDLAESARDEIALAVPLRPLCRVDCPGLCPTCGTDLNREPCGGHDEEPDSPFAVLRGLLDQDLSQP
ncbi:MAG: YceD family protein [Acidimicrobiia bacterium]